MPRYVILANWTDQGIENVKQTTDRMDHGGELAEKHGLGLEQAYWTVGAYDMAPSSRPLTTKPWAPTSWKSALLATYEPSRYDPTTRKRCQGYSGG
jgi:hypothetical protein